MPPHYSPLQANDHDPWCYIYFIDYLMGKDITELNGVEQYVTEQLQRNEMVSSVIYCSRLTDTPCSYR